MQRTKALALTADADDTGLIAYSDASYAPEGSENAGCKGQVWPGALAQPQDLSCQPLGCPDGLLGWRLIRQESVEGDKVSRAGNLT